MKEAEVCGEVLISASYSTHDRDIMRRVYLVCTLQSLVTVMVMKVSWKLSPPVSCAGSEVQQ